jgi:hypothetical protein
MKMFILSLVLVLGSLVACTGDTGPAGPKGDKGNANVLSGSLAPADTEWLWNSVYTLRTADNTTTSWFTRYVDVALTQINADIIANGAVLVYMEPLPASGTWVPLNYSYTSFGGTYMFNFAYEASDGLLRLHFFMTPNTGANPSSQTWVLPTYNFRYVIIAGTALQSMQAAGVDVGDYEQVRSYTAADGRGPQGPAPMAR